MKRAGRLRVQGSHLDHPNYRTALTRRRAELTALEESLGNAVQRARQENGLSILDVHANPTAWRRTLVDLLRHQVLLLAMKHGRAPLPVSPAVLKSLLRRGILNDLHDLGSVARRLSFLEDGRILLAELKTRTARRAPAEETMPKEKEIAAEVRS